MTEIRTYSWRTAHIVGSVVRDQLAELGHSNPI
jgi:hypothetical protein